ncbi:2Fe-2S iron-sulfur cluster-binding protein [Streptomyces sp. NPDC026672]|uniref:2Fe-2S iron-sulfur cluster-binding protein n=1 Tax=unclassified Streptomyces TaxID=2593676 RepID=UPI0033DD7FE8
MTPTGLGLPRRLLEFTLDGEPVRVPEGTTVLDACRSAGKDVPALCHTGGAGRQAPTCRLCVVETDNPDNTGNPGNPDVAGDTAGTDDAAPLVPACARAVEPGMAVRTDTERVRHSRRTVLELLASTADLSTTPRAAGWIEEYGARPDRFGPDAARPDDGPPRLDDELIAREPDKCVLCRRCVDVCGEQGPYAFALAVTGRGFATRIAAEHDAPLPDSACVYCGDCLDVCPTGALSARTEFDLRAAGTWDVTRRTTTATVCGHCDAGCGVVLHVQDNDIVRVTSPQSHPVTRGHLCFKGRFGHQYAQNRG